MYIADETEDEDVNKEYAEETNRDAVMIAASKLVATDTVPKVKKWNCDLLPGGNLMRSFLFIGTYCNFPNYLSSKICF